MLDAADANYVDVDVDKGPPTMHMQATNIEIIRQTTDVNDSPSNVRKENKLIDV